MQRMMFSCFAVLSLASTACSLSGGGTLTQKRVQAVLNDAIESVATSTDENERCGDFERGTTTHWLISGKGIVTVNGLTTEGKRSTADLTITGLEVRPKPNVQWFGGLPEPIPVTKSSATFSQYDDGRWVLDELILRTETHVGFWCFRDSKIVVP